MRQGGKKTFKKKTIWQISRKVNEGDEIETFFDLLKKKINQGYEKNWQNKNSGKNVFYLLK